MLPLIKTSLDLSNEGLFLQAWYADDGTGLGKLQQLREWWRRVSTIGPRYGYYANAKKTVLVVKAAHVEKAKQKTLTSRLLRVVRAIWERPLETKTSSDSTLSRKFKSGALNSRHSPNSPALNHKPPTRPSSSASEENGTSCNERFQTARISSNHSKT